MKAAPHQKYFREICKVNDRKFKRIELRDTVDDLVEERQEQEDYFERMLDSDAMTAAEVGFLCGYMRDEYDGE